MSNAPQQRGVRLGDAPPARSRHAGKRSAVTLLGELVVAGTATGEVVAHDRATLDERWRKKTRTEMTSVVAAEPSGSGVVVGEHSLEGTIRFHDQATGELRWQYATATDIGTPQKSSRFFLPFVADIETDGDQLYVASRRYERDGDRRSFTSVVYAFDEAGDIVWRRDTDASPISLAVWPLRIIAVQGPTSTGWPSSTLKRVPSDTSGTPGLTVIDASVTSRCSKTASSLRATVTTVDTVSTTGVPKSGVSASRHQQRSMTKRYTPIRTTCTRQRTGPSSSRGTRIRRSAARLRRCTPVSTLPPGTRRTGSVPGRLQTVASQANSVSTETGWLFPEHSTFARAMPRSTVFEYSVRKLPPKRPSKPMISSQQSHWTVDPSPP